MSFARLDGLALSCGGSGETGDVRVGAPARCIPQGGHPPPGSDDSGRAGSFRDCGLRIAQRMRRLHDERQSCTRR